MGLSALFGSAKAVEGIADTVKSGINLLDEAFYTNQEKAENAGKFIDSWIRIQEVTAQENSLKSITRRILACLILGNFLFVFNIGVVLILIGADERVDKLISLVEKFQIGWMALSVVIFYFGYYGWQMLKGKKGK